VAVARPHWAGSVAAARPVWLAGIVLCWATPMSKDECLESVGVGAGMGGQGLVQWHEDLAQRWEE